MEKEIGLITAYLDKIAAKLGVTVEMVWPWFIRQQYVEAIAPTLIWVVTLPALLLCARYVGEHWHPDQDGGETYSIWNSDHEPLWCIVLAILGTIFAVFFFYSVLEFFDIFNPEYAALRDLSKMATGR